jgi:hypothetical protein
MAGHLAPDGGREGLAVDDCRAHVVSFSVTRGREIARPIHGLCSEPGFVHFHSCRGPEDGLVCGDPGCGLALATHGTDRGDAAPMAGISESPGMAAISPDRRSGSRLSFPNRAIAVKVPAPARTASKQGSRIPSGGQATLPRCRGSNKSAT